MKNVVIGKNDSGKKFTLNIPKLLTSRLLVQASAGGGKSYAIRKIIEQTNGHVQQIILDIEDDFSTLRESFDFVLIGRGGDISADPRSADLLARKLLELEADAIINLYELKPFERIRFVKNFLDAMVNSPKELWHPCMVILDEAHHFAPEKSKSESLNAVADMASRGRKRGFCLIPATQRLSKLNKDVAAECQNKLIGLSNMDIDRKRASEELGFTERAKILELRDLEPGEFFAVGPSFDRGVTKIKIDKVKTTHHEAGKIFKRSNKVVTTKKVQQILQKLADLPKEVEDEIKTVASLEQKIRDLKLELRSQKVKVETKVEKVIDPKVIAQEVNKFKREFFKILTQEQKKFVASLESAFKDVKIESPNKAAMAVPSAIELHHLLSKPITPKDQKFLKRAVDTNSSLGRCEKAILKFLAMRNSASFSKTQIGAMTQYSPTSGGFNSAISRLFQLNYILRHGDRISINAPYLPEIRDILGSDYASPDGDSRVGWLSKLGKCERVIFETVCKDAARDFDKSELGELTGYSSSSGGFNNAISRLRTLGLIQKNGDGSIRYNEELVGL